MEFHLFTELAVIVDDHLNMPSKTLLVLILHQNVIISNCHLSTRVNPRVIQINVILLAAVLDADAVFFFSDVSFTHNTLE